MSTVTADDVNQLTLDAWLAELANHGVEPWMVMGGMRGVEEIDGRSFVEITSAIGYLPAYARMRAVDAGFITGYIDEGYGGCEYSAAYYLLVDRRGPDGRICFYAECFRNNRFCLAGILADDVLAQRSVAAGRKAA